MGDEVDRLTAAPLPPDDSGRGLAVARADASGMRHLAVAGATYTILLTGADTAGHYCLIDMHVPPGGGPPPHRHDFEEMFTVLEGEIEGTFRGETQRAGAGQTVKVPGNAAHAIKKVSGTSARPVFMCTPPGAGEVFPAVGALG